MDPAAAIRAVAPSAPEDVIAGFHAARPGLARLGALANPRRVAHMIGQCAHESARFRHRVEVLSYSAERLVAVWPRRFPTIAAARPFARNPEALANHVYAGRMGNGDAASGDGWRYRGRGWIQLTGRANYRRAGARLGIDLEAEPERAAEPATAWLVAADYLARRRRAGRSAFAWADRDNVEMVTRIVNGGLHGLAERRMLTAMALAALAADAAAPLLVRGARGPAVVTLQMRLAEAGFPPGAIDGDFGPATEAALRAFQAARGLAVTGRADAITWAALAPTPAAA